MNITISTKQEPFYSHYTDQPVLASTRTVKNWMILLEQSFIAHVPLLMATSAIVFGRRHYDVTYAISISYVSVLH